tara:strand:+ start:5601 stop:6545 length:945 start_codon:yes stop_codon:yes gene_type:complete
MFYKDKKVVVTGGSGFLGTHFIQELLKREAIVKTSIHKSPLQNFDTRVEVLDDINLKKLDDCIKLIKGADYVIHSAGDIANPKLVPNDFQIALNQITIITNVLEASYKCSIKGFIDLNSSTGYPDRRYSVTEEEFWDDEPYISYYGYGWMRRYREKLMEHCSHLTDMKIGIARGTAIFGPYDNFDLETCHVIPAFIKRLIDGEDPFIAWGSPDVIRDFMYAKDVINGVLLILEKGKSMRPYNLGYGNKITIGSVLDSIKELTGKSPLIKWDNSKPTTIPFRQVSNNRIKQELGFYPEYSFYQGLKETIEWYTSQ